MIASLSLKGIIKRYKGFQLGPLDFDIEPGLVVGMIGPNGSGKTTAINIMAGLVRPDDGAVEISGRKVDQNHPEWKFDLGYIGDDPVFYERWSGAKNLKFISQFFPDWSDDRAVELARRFNLDLDKKAFELSKGNRAKLYLITVLARSPKLFLFDEPTSGLDPVVRNEVLEVLWEMMASGERSVLYSTHILSDVNRIADELIFLIDGKLSLRCNKEDLTDRWGRLAFSTSQEFPDLKGIVNHRSEGSRHIVITANLEETEKQLASLGIHNVEATRLSIEEIAVYILKEGGDVANR